MNAGVGANLQEGSTQFRLSPLCEAVFQDWPQENTRILGAWTSRPHRLRHTSFKCSEKSRFALRAQCGRDVRVPRVNAMVLLTARRRDWRRHYVWLRPKTYFSHFCLNAFISTMPRIFCRL